MKYVKCPCGIRIKVFPSRIGRAKYCSKSCKYKYSIRRSGLNYHIKVVNKAWFKKGQNAWNKGTRGVVKRNAGSFKKGQRASIDTEFKVGHERNVGENNVKWLGDSVGYGGVHSWIKRWLGKSVKCENREKRFLPFSCNNKSNTFDWANRSRKYKRNVEDWVQLCRSCHFKADKNNIELVCKTIKKGA